MSPFLLGVISVAGTAATAGARPANGVTLTEKPGHVTEGSIVIDAPPAEVYRVATDYARWPQVLTDTSAVRVERGGPRDARVRFRSHAIGYEVTLAFDNVPDRAIRFHLVGGPPGGRAHGEYQLEPIDGGRHTRVVADLYLEVVGPPGWFVSGASLRHKREAKIDRDLSDIARWLAAQQRSAAAAP